MSREITVEVKVQIPDKATHYYGDLLDHPSFYYMSIIGVAGEHWWSLSSDGVWRLASHHKPHWIKEIPV